MTDSTRITLRNTLLSNSLNASIPLPPHPQSSVLINVPNPGLFLNITGITGITGKTGNLRTNKRRNIESLNLTCFTAKNCSVYAEVVTPGGNTVKSSTVSITAGASTTVVLQFSKGTATNRNTVLTLYGDPQSISVDVDKSFVKFVPTDAEVMSFWIFVGLGSIILVLFILFIVMLVMFFKKRQNT
jgi:hypothetical protein